jgi:hypothetical protein
MIQTGRASLWEVRPVRFQRFPHFAHFHRTSAFPETILSASGRDDAARSLLIDTRGVSPMSALTTTISDRKAAANRANAQKSTGPKTAEGKAKVSLNAVTHGLCAATVVLPNENHDEYEAMRLAWLDDWKPQTEARRVLVDRAAAGAWRLRRCVKAERDRIAEGMAAALDAYDDGVEARVADGLRLLQIEPRQGLATLRSEHAGMVALISLWESLGRAFADPSAWNDPHRHHVRLLNLLGFGVETDAADLGPAAMGSWRLLVRNVPEVGDCDEPIASDREAHGVASAMAKFVAAHVTGLRGELDRYPDPNLVRARVADSAAYDTSREAQAMQRYEGQLDRSFRANLNQLIKLTQTGADLVEDASPAPEPNKPTEPEPTAPNEPTEAQSDLVPPNKPTLYAPSSPLGAASMPPIEAGLDELISEH